MALPTRVSRSERNDPTEMMRRDFGDLIGRFLGDEWGEGGRLAPFGVDIREDPDHIYVEADLPGFRKEDVDITLENGLLTISAERSEEQPQQPQQQQGQQKGKQQQQQDQGQRQQQQKGQYLLRERRYQRFFRSFTLPNNVNEQQVDAKLHDGCLTITLNKREKSKPRRVKVS